jgi:hypothetical protein
MWLDLSGSGEGPVVMCCEYGNELSGSMNTSYCFYCRRVRDVACPEGLCCVKFTCTDATERVRGW